MSLDLKGRPFVVGVNDEDHFGQTHEGPYQTYDEKPYRVNGMFSKVDKRRNKTRLSKEEIETGQPESTQFIVQWRF